MVITEPLPPKVRAVLAQKLFVEKAGLPSPLPQFIEQLYEKRFGRERPEVVMTVEERARVHDAKKTARKEARRRARALSDGRSPEGA